MATMAKAQGKALDLFLSSLWSSDVVAYRAAGLIEMAQQELMNEHAEAKAKKQNRGRWGRR